MSQSYSPYDGAFRLEPPNIFSYGNWKLGTGSTTFPWLPLKYSNKDTADNKGVLNSYTDTSGIEPVACFSDRVKFASGYDSRYTERVGGNDITRDIKTWSMGIGPMPYIAGTQPLPALSPLAPHPSGVQEWKPGMTCIGHSLENSVVYTGSSTVMAYINTTNCQKQLKPYTQTVTMDVSGSLTFAPTSIDYAYGSGSASGAKGYFIIPSGQTEAVRDLSVAFDAANGTNVLHVAATDGATSMTVRYWYFG